MSHRPPDLPQKRPPNDGPGGRRDGDGVDLVGVWALDEPPSAVDIELLERRWRRGRRLVVAAETLVLAGLVMATLMALRGPLDGASLVLWGHAWVLVAVVVGFAIRNRRGLGRDLSRSTADFLELWRLRCLRGLRTVRFVWLVLAAELLFYAVFRMWTGRGDARSVLVLGGLVVLYLGWSVLYRRSCLEQLERIDELRQVD